MVPIDPTALAADLARQGYARLPLLKPAECHDLAALYGQEAPFRSRVVMQRHGYGSGEYKYLTYPLPGLVADLRTALYPPLAAIANDWAVQLGEARRYPDELAAYLDQGFDFFVRAVATPAGLSRHEQSRKPSRKARAAPARR